MKLILKWLLSASALLTLTYLYSGVQISNFSTALLAAFAIGLLNIVLRPLLILLTLPVTVLTLGLFLFVINALVFWASSGLIPGFAVTGFGAALLGSFFYSCTGLVIDSALEGLFPRKHA